MILRTSYRLIEFRRLQRSLPVAQLDLFHQLKDESMMTHRGGSTRYNVWSARAYHSVTSWHSPRYSLDRLHEPRSVENRLERVHHFGTTTTSNNDATRVHLPKLGQNGTLVLRSNCNSIAKVQIISQWRDDAMLELLPLSLDGSGIDADRDAGADVDVATFDGTPDTSIDSSSDSTTQTFGQLQLKSHADGITTSLGRKGTLIEVDISNSNNKTNEPMELIAIVPEKSNITCQLSNGDICIPGKIEGDIHLSTNDGNIYVSKLRGHNVTLDTTSKDDNVPGSNVEKSLGVIHVSKAVEARSIQISTSSRVRARMLNGSQVSIQAMPMIEQPQYEHDSFDKLDDDDEGVTIDIGSLYVSSGGSGDVESDNKAQLIVDNSNMTKNERNISSGGLVRVKSSHGHVTVHAKMNQTSPSSSKEKETAPLVDFGGVNGSCDITLEATPDSTDQSKSGNTTAAAHVHFDAMTPESISTITTRGISDGHTSVTMDRKLEAEVRLLSVVNSGSTFPLEFDAYSLTSDNVEEVTDNLDGVKTSIRENPTRVDTSLNDKRSPISIETDAYRDHETLDSIQLNGTDGVEYTMGTMKNRSGEPDSRFDVKSRGKINIDGAASQALHGFRGKHVNSEADENSSVTLPLLAVATDGTIKLETLSWFGSIARRYGMEENDSRGVGRQASRKPRLDE